MAESAPAVPETPPRSLRLPLPAQLARGVRRVIASRESPDLLRDEVDEAREQASLQEQQQLEQASPLLFFQPALLRSPPVLISIPLTGPLPAPLPLPSLPSAVGTADAVDAAGADGADGADDSDHAGEEKSSKSKRPPRFKCDVCHVSFRRTHHLIRHKAAVHRKEYTVFCSVCSRGFSDITHLNAHRRQHSDSETSLPTSVRLLRRENSDLHIELQGLRRAAALAKMSKCTDARCAVSSARASVDRDLHFFNCFKCRHATHYTCSGYHDGMRGDAVLLCLHCVKEAGLPAHICLLEHTDTAILRHYIVEDLKLRVVDVPPDGACLIRSILAARNADGKLPEGKHVCEFIRNIIAHDNSLQTTFPEECTQIVSASNAVLLARLRTLWHSPLFDDLLFHIAPSLMRPIHIYLCMEGKVSKIDIPCSCPPVAPPLCLMRSCFLLQFDHYSAVF